MPPHTNAKQNQNQNQKQNQIQNQNQNQIKSITTHYLSKTLCHFLLNCINIFIQTKDSVRQINPTRRHNENKMKKYYFKISFQRISTFRIVAFSVPATLNLISNYIDTSLQPQWCRLHSSIFIIITIETVIADVIDVITKNVVTAVIMSVAMTMTMTMAMLRYVQNVRRHRRKQQNFQLQNGICIIRLISLKRFSQIPMNKQNELEQKENQNEKQKQMHMQKQQKQIKSKENAKEENNIKINVDLVVVKKLDKLKDMRAGVGNHVASVEEKRFFMLARLIPERFEKYIAIRLQFYKFNLQPIMTVARNNAMAMAVATRPSDASKTPALSQTAVHSVANRTTTMKETKTKTTKTITLRKLSTEFEIVGKSKDTISTRTIPVSECCVKNVDSSRTAASISTGRNVAFVFDVGNGKKCGNPLQISTRILVLVMYMFSRVYCGCNGSSGLRQFRYSNNKRTTRTTYHNSSWSSLWSWSWSWSCLWSSSLSLSLSWSRTTTHSFSLQRSLIMLILLSALWQESEGIHGSVKLSSNTVKTKYGLLRGIIVRSTPSVVEAYLGIPYASPPVGSLRYMPPITPSTWKNIRNADRFSPVCPQTVPIPPNGPEALLEVPRARLAQLRRLLPLLKNQSEDCLYLNIYVPYENRRHRRFAEHDEASPKLSTILFIHGESYDWNSGNPYDGSELAVHGNVIVVTINFRLGVFGFLKTGGKESAQGNFGLMDLVAGLHWLKENLPAFGGDPQSITLLGHGTGAALANILIVSPVASDLIQQAVLISGSALSPWAIQKNPLLVKRRVAEQTGCHGDMLYYDIAPCLRTKSVAELLAISIEHPRFLVGFAPFIDGTVISPNLNGIGSLTLPLGSAIVSTSGIEFANFPKRNLIFCLTSVESYLDLSAQDLEFGFNETRRDRILRTFVRNNYHYHLNEIFAVLKNEYTDWEKAIRNPLSSRDATLAFLSDGHTASSLIKLGYMHSLRGGQSYFLHFKHKTMEEEYPQRTGSVRGEDVPFWFGLPVSPLFPYNYTTQEKQISRLMLRYLANFAKTGNPNQSTKSLQKPLLSTSTVTSNVAYQPQNFNSNNDMSIDSQRLSQYNHLKFKRASAKTDSLNRFLNMTTKQALDLAIIYNQRRSNAMRDKRTNRKRHLRSNDDINQNDLQNKSMDSDLPFWDAYDVVNQLYLELGNKVEVLSHYRGHKLSMWLNLIPQLHKHSNMNDQSMRHHQFADDIHNHNLYEGVVRPQLQTKPVDEEEVIIIQAPKSVAGAALNKTNASNSAIITTPSTTTTTECGVDGALLITTDLTTQSSNDNRSLSEKEKDLATTSTGVMGNLEVLRRLSGKQFQSYTTALVATVAVGCFLLILNVLIFAGIYHQREKRARDAKTKEELQDNDTSKNSSLMKLNTVGLTLPGDVGKTTMIFGEYSCYDEKTKQLQTAIDEKLLVELPPPTVQAALHDTNWACSTSTLDLLQKTKHQQMDTPTSIATVPNILSNETNEIHLHHLTNMEMATYHPISISTTMDTPISVQQHNKCGSFGSSAAAAAAAVAAAINSSNSNLNQFDYAVQSSDQMSFKDIENAVKASTDNITHDIDDDIPEPPPPPRSFQQQQQQQQQQSLQQSAQGGGGILRQSGGASVASTSSGKKRVHIQEISV